MAITGTPPRSESEAAGLRRVLLNGVALLGAYVLPRACTFAAALVAARVLGPAEFGAYGTAASFAMILSVLATLGMLPLLVRELARQPERARSVLRAAHLIKLVAAALMLVVSYLLARFILGYPSHIVQAIVLLAIGHTFAALAENLGAWFQAQERMHIWLQASVWFGVVSGALGILLVVWTRSVPAFAAAFAAGQLCALLWLLQRLPASARGAGLYGAGEAQRLLRASAPFALAFLALTIFYKVDVLLLERLRESGEVGLYAAGYKLIDVVHALAVVAAGAMYPRLARATSTDARASAGQRSIELFLLAGVLGSGMLWLSRGPLTLLLFGSDYAATAHVLGWLAPALIALVINILAGYLLSAADRIALMAAAYAGACTLKLLLGFWWIPQAGALGMAQAKLVSEALLAVVLLSVLAQVGAGAVRTRPLVLAGAAALLAVALAQLPWLAALPPALRTLAFATSVIVLFVQGQALSTDEWRTLRAAVQAKGNARRSVSALPGDVAMHAGAGDDSDGLPLQAATAENAVTFVQAVEKR